MSNLRSDCRDMVKDLPAGDKWKVHIQALCNQIDLIEGWLHEANRRLKAIRETLGEAVCTEGCDKGVVMLSQDGPTHPETINGKTIQVYDHEYFSPLGDALIAAWDKSEGVWGEPVNVTVP